MARHLRLVSYSLTLTPMLRVENSPLVLNAPSSECMKFLGVSSTIFVMCDVSMSYSLTVLPVNSGNCVAFWLMLWRICAPICLFASLNPTPIAYPYQAQGLLERQA